MKRIKNSKKGLITDIRDKGKVRVIIENPLTQASNFKEMYNRMKEGDVVWMTNLPTKKEKENTGNNDWRSGFSGMNFRLPPIPPNEGFNIFGSINNLKLKSGMGKIMIGGRAFDVNAPSIIEFRNLKTLRLEDKDKPIPVPIQLDHLNNKAKFQLQGTAEVSINEESLNIKADKYKYLCNYILLILQLLSVIVGSITIIMQRRNTPE